MAIVKASYTTSAAKSKKTVRYIQHRAGRDGERITRTLFGVDGPLTREEVYQLIDEAPAGAFFYHLKISPDPRREDTARDLDLREITDETLFALSQKLRYHVEYAGSVHDDHTPIRHVHVLAIAWKQLDRADLKVMRESATEAAMSQRQERDATRGSEQGRQPVSLPVPQQRRFRRQRGISHYKRPKQCLICGEENCREHDISLDVQLEREV